MRSLSMLVSIGLMVSVASAAELPKLATIAVSKDKKGFITSNGKPFTPWGFNYDHDSTGRLIEDYWETDWASIEGDFAEMKQLGANVVRLHLQLGKFMTTPDQPNELSLKMYRKVVELAEKTGLYLDVTGLGCYHKKDIPDWYDAMSEEDRWTVQARFWKAVANVSKDSPAIFCYDLMNEPVSPAGQRKGADWLGPPLGDKHFVQRISLDRKDRKREDIAKAWISTLVKAIKEVDQKHLITVGLVDWSLDRPGLSSGFIPDKIAGDLDFLAVHLYHVSGKLQEDMETLKGFQIGKPVIIEEMFPLKSSSKELAEFITASNSNGVARGWISFYWGKPVEELKKAKSIGEAILGQWLGVFMSHPLAPKP
jgi:hypothetical protein